MGALLGAPLTEPDLSETMRVTSAISIEATALSVGYEQKKVLERLEFRANPGELTVLVGPNGCGKSTLLKAISRVLPLAGGAVCLAGQDIRTLARRDVARLMSFLPQGPIAPEGLTVRELVAQGRFPHQTLLRQWSQEDAQAVERALDQTNLVDLAERPVSDLSGGQRQRAWIAMVLAQDTPVMLLDEPTAFLDLKVQVDLLCLLHAVARQQGRTVVLVLHDLNIAASLADRIVMMRDGAIQAEGSVAEVFTAENLKRVFELEASILTDPNTGRPMCAPVVTPFVTRTSDPAPAVALGQQEAG